MGKKWFQIRAEQSQTQDSNIHFMCLTGPGSSAPNISANWEAGEGTRTRAVNEPLQSLTVRLLAY